MPNRYIRMPRTLLAIRYMDLHEHGAGRCGFFSLYAVMKSLRAALPWLLSGAKAITPVYKEKRKASHLEGEWSVSMGSRESNDRKLT